MEAYKTCPTIQEIVLINQYVQAVEVYRRNDTGWTQIFYGPGTDVELQSVDVLITMGEIYKGIDFEEPLIDE